jgi:hypothetical protein
MSKALSGELWLLKTPNAPRSLEFFEFADAISPACLSSCDRSLLGLYADSLVERLWN